MASRSWGTSEDGTIDYYSYCDRNHHDGFREVLNRSFYPFETFSKALNIEDCPEAKEELNGLMKKCLEDGISLVAVDKLTGRVTGFAVNKLQVQNDILFDELLKNFKHEKSQQYLLAMKNLDKFFDYNKYYELKCWVELIFLAVLPEYRNRGIAKDLIRATIEMSKKLSCGQNLDGKKLDIERIPQLLLAFFTSPVSQRIGNKCGFEGIATISHKDLHLNGNAWVKKLEDISSCTILAMKKLKYIFFNIPDR